MPAERAVAVWLTQHEAAWLLDTLQDWAPASPIERSITRSVRVALTPPSPTARDPRAKAARMLAELVDAHPGELTVDVAEGLIGHLTWLLVDDAALIDTLRALDDAPPAQT